MTKKIYLLTEDEVDLVEHQRTFMKDYIAEVEATNLLMHTTHDEYALKKIRQALARGEKVILPKKATAPIDDIWYWLKRKLGKGVM